LGSSPTGFSNHLTSDLSKSRINKTHSGCKLMAGKFPAAVERHVAMLLPHSSDVFVGATFFSGIVLYEVYRRLAVISPLFCLLDSLVAQMRIRIMANDASLSARIQRNFLTRYGAAFVGIAGALLIARSLNPILGISSFYVAAFPALAFSAWCCGL